MAVHIQYSPRYNIAPGQTVPVIGEDLSGRWLAVMRWGLVPHWAKEASIGHKLINARAETLTDKPSFRDSFHHRRCLIPADGFYEWKKEGKTSTPYRIVLPGQELFAFAGLWDRWDANEGSIFSFTIITTTASPAMQEIHSRMPVILRGEPEYAAWLDGSTDTGTLKKMLRPCEERLHIYPVSRLVNSPRNDLPELVREQEQ